MQLVLSASGACRFGIPGVLARLVGAVDDASDTCAMFNHGWVLSLDWDQPDP